MVWRKITKAHRDIWEQIKIKVKYHDKFYYVLGVKCPDCGFEIESTGIPTGHECIVGEKQLSDSNDWL